MAFQSKRYQRELRSIKKDLEKIKVMLLRIRDDDEALKLLFTRVPIDEQRNKAIEETPSVKSTPIPTPKVRVVKCLRCLGAGHSAIQCPHWYDEPKDELLVDLQPLTTENVCDEVKNSSFPLNCLEDITHLEVDMVHSDNVMEDPIQEDVIIPIIPLEETSQTSLISLDVSNDEHIKREVVVVSGKILKVDLDEKGNEEISKDVGDIVVFGSSFCLTHHAGYDLLGVTFQLDLILVEFIIMVFDPGAQFQDSRTNLFRGGRD